MKYFIHDHDILRIQIRTTIWRYHRQLKVRSYWSIWQLYTSNLQCKNTLILAWRMIKTIGEGAKKEKLDYSIPNWINPLDIFLKIYFIYFWLCWVFVAMHRLSIVAARGATLRCSVRASHCSGFSHCGAWALGEQASVVVACGLSRCCSWALERRLSSCGAWA